MHISWKASYRLADAFRERPRSHFRSLDYFRTRPSSVDMVISTVWGCTGIRRTQWIRDLLHQPSTCQNPWKISKVRKNGLIYFIRFEFQMNGRMNVLFLLKPKGRHLNTSFKNYFLFSRNHKLPWRHEYQRVLGHFFLWPWLWLNLLCFQSEQEPDKSSL